MQGKIQEKAGNVSFAQAFKDFFKGYADFKGHSTRGGFWWVQLQAFLFGIAFGIILGVASACASDTLVGAIGLIFGLALIAIIIPSIALAFRRLRDVGFSTAGILTILIAYIVLAILGEAVKFFSWLAIALSILMWVCYVLPGNMLKGKLGFLTEKQKRSSFEPRFFLLFSRNKFKQISCIFSC